MRRSAWGGALALAFALPLAGGCTATFDRYPAPPSPVEASRPPPERGPVVVAFTWQHLYEPMEDAGQDAAPPEPEAAPAWLVRTLRSEYGFTAVRSPHDTAQWRARVHVRSVRKVMQGALLHLASAFLIPATQEHRIEVRVALEGPGDGKSRSIVRRHRLTAWRELFLLPFVFTHSPTFVREDARRAMVREGFAALLEEGPGPEAAGRPARATVPAGGGAR